MCSLWPFSLDAEQEDEDLHVVVEKSDLTVVIDKENQGVIDGPTAISQDKGEALIKRWVYTLYLTAGSLGTAATYEPTNHLLFPIQSQSQVFGSIDSIHDLSFFSI